MPRIDSGTLEEGLEKLSAVVVNVNGMNLPKRQARYQRKLPKLVPELVNTVVVDAPKGKQGQSVPPAHKYRYLDNGVEKPGPSQGRMPSVIAKAVAEGKSVEKVPSDPWHAVPPIKTSPGEVLMPLYELSAYPPP